MLASGILLVALLSGSKPLQRSKRGSNLQGRVDQVETNKVFQCWDAGPEQRPDEGVQAPSSV